MRAWLSIVMLAAAMGSASAQHANDEAIALALFNEGRALAKAGDLAHACPKFEAAERLTGWLGVELNLADCYVGVGRTASAWVLFRKAADKAEKTGDARAAYARTRAAQLEPDLARLTITTATPTVEVRIDDVVLTGDELGVAVPVDPGTHHVEARLPGISQPWSREVTVAAHTLITVEIPRPIERPTPVPATAPQSHANRWLAPTLGAVGGIMIGTSLGLGVSAKLRYDSAVRDHCNDDLMCGEAGLAGIAAARQRANAATIVGGVGVMVAAAALVVHVATHDDDQAPRLSLAPMLTPDGVGVAVGGSL